MDIHHSTALVTGGNRGLGRAFAVELLRRGAAKVYVAARNPSSVDLPGVTPLRMDVTDPASVAAAAAAAPDVTLLINNAGISTHTRLTDGDLESVRLEMETHFFGALGVTRAFLPALKAAGDGAVLNIGSSLSWEHYPDYGAYSTAKAALWAMSNVIRQELAPFGVDVTSLHVGYMDTDMADYVDPSNKTDPALVAALALDGVQARALEVVADDITRRAKAGLSGEPRDVYTGVHAAR